MGNLKTELTRTILPFWIEKMQDKEHGGFYGRMDGENTLCPQAKKGGILNARILWTFSAAYRVLGDPLYLEMAERAYDYINMHFIDREYGGLFWELDCTGKPVHTKKQTYLQGFALYGFSEFYRATGRQESLERAISLFRLIEEKACDPLTGGYFEAFTREWQAIEDMRLSDKDANEKKTMNTHLHVLEPYTNLMRVWRDPQLIDAQGKLMDIFLNKIINKNTFHLDLFFDENWVCKSEEVSYGHDIEASWLLFEAAEVMGGSKLLETIRPLSLQIAKAALEGLQADGSLIYEAGKDHRDTDRHWWVQAETVVGLVYAWENSKDSEYLKKARQCWQFIRQHLSDKEQGEWIWSVDEQGRPNRTDDKAGFWKCPYHNSRMCLEIIEKGIEL